MPGRASGSAVPETRWREVRADAVEVCCPAGGAALRDCPPARRWVGRPAMHCLAAVLACASARGPCTGRRCRRREGDSDSTGQRTAPYGTAGLLLRPAALVRSASSSAAGRPPAGCGMPAWGSGRPGREAPAAVYRHPRHRLGAEPGGDRDPLSRSAAQRTCGFRCDPSLSLFLCVSSGHNVPPARRIERRFTRR